MPINSNRRSRVRRRTRATSSPPCAATASRTSAVWLTQPPTGSPSCVRSTSCCPAAEPATSSFCRSRAVARRRPEHFKSSQADAREDVLILAGFNPNTAAGSQQRILGSEFNHLIKQFALKGAQVLFIADAAYNGGLARNVDPRAAEVSYRQARPYTIAQDTLEPISTADDVSLNGDGLARATILAAGERTAAAPEVRIPGEAGLRGALSYAVARALEGAADEDHDGHVTKDELIRYVSQVTYQLSDQRQHVPAQPTSPNSGAEVLYGRTRGVVLLDPQPRPGARPPQLSPSTSAPSAPAPSKPAASTPERPVPALDPVRVAVLGNQTELLKAVQPKEANFQPVTVSENPDLIWDPVTLEVVTNGDVVARQINRQELPGVIDRIAAINGFKRLAAKVAPDSARASGRQGLFTGLPHRSPGDWRSAARPATFQYRRRRHRSGAISNRLGSAHRYDSGLQVFGRRSRAVRRGSGCCRHLRAAAERS